jgi:biofilm PGA synthesis N-glycosyltransferase PgaC
MTTKILQFISDFTFIYPVLMAYIWMGGAFIFLVSREIFLADKSSPPSLKSYPRVAILVACFNEEEIIEETIANLDQQTYPNLEIIAVNDGSSDRTGELLDKAAGDYQRLRVVQLTNNQGKATALRTAHAATAAEYVIVVDADVMLEPDVAVRMVHRLEANPRLGAVTGNPRIRNRGSLLGRIQAGEFSSIIGMIKRAQSVYGRLFTVSGCIAGFRHSAIQDAGYWSVDMATEDVDISWRLQLKGWFVQYEPSAICWVLMPETLSGLWKQRLRWAQGGAEVLLRYSPKLFRSSSIWMWPIYIESLLSILWSFLICIVLVLFVADVLFPMPESFNALHALWPSSAIIICTTFILQSIFAMIIDSRYERKTYTLIFWMIWYPLGYWLITACTSMVGFWKAFGRSKRKRATWTSPDRGKMEP